MFPMILGNLPAGCSINQVKHYHQEIKSGKFCQYDHEKDNQKMYNQSTPPEYDLKNVICPIALFYGSNDNLAAPEDVLKLAGELPNKVEVHEMDKPKWNHIDFLYAYAAPELYKRMGELNKAYQ